MKLLKKYFTLGIAGRKMAKWGFIMKKRIKNSLMARLAVLLLILIIPFNIIGIATALISYHNSKENAEATISYTLDSYATLLETKIDNTNVSLYDLANDTDLFNLSLSKNDSEYALTRYRLFTALSNQVRTSNIADIIFIYNTERDDYLQVPTSGTSANTRPHYVYMENYGQYHSSWFFSEDKSELIRVLYDSQLHIYYGAAIDLTSFLSQINRINGFSGLSYAFSDQKPKSTASLLYFSAEAAPDVYLTAGISAMELGSSISFLQYALILFFIIYLALIPILYRILKHYVGTPLRQLNDAHTQLKEGNEDYRITLKGNSLEFDSAYQSFNAMASSLQTLHQEVIRKELQNKQLQIDFLQLQIRPHFLLNSFNVLFTLIQRNQKEHATEMVLFLSDYFRYLFRSGSELQLFSKERDLVEKYMNVSKISYPVSFEVSYQIDPILDLMRVPPLLFHSFMENIISHALLPDRQIHIVFSGEYDNGVATFYISDDGRGIDPQALDAINHIDETTIDDGKNVGIKNSIRRLKYYYGDAANVECDSELGVGTTFIITIPYNLEES